MAVMLDDRRTLLANTLHYVAQQHRHFLGLALSRISDNGFPYPVRTFSDLPLYLLEEGLTEVLHKSNFRREKFGYENHRHFSAELERLPRVWTLKLFVELKSSLDAADAKNRAITGSDSVDLPKYLLDDLIEGLPTAAASSATGVW